MHGQDTYNQSHAAFCVKSDLGLELIRVLLRCFQATGVLQNYDRKLDAEESLEDLRELGLEVKDARTGNYLAPGSGGVQPVSDSARGANVNGKEGAAGFINGFGNPATIGKPLAGQVAHV